MAKKYLPRSIPVELLHPIVKAYIDKQEMGSAPQYGNFGVGNAYSATQVLAWDAGVGQRIVQNIYHNRGYFDKRNGGKRFEKVAFRTADRLLVAMGKEYLWFQEPLSEFYVLKSQAA